MLKELAVPVAITIAAIAFAGTRRRKVGTFLGIPYDWRWPSPAVWRERFWNPADPRVFTPHVFGWGWSVNLPSLGRRLRRTVGTRTGAAHVEPSGR